MQVNVTFLSREKNLRNQNKTKTITTKFIGITKDNKLKIDNVCLKANGKLFTLREIRKYLHFNKTRILFKVFLQSQLKHCPLKWIIYSRGTNRRINHLHERALRLVYDYYESTFEEHLEKIDHSLFIITIFRCYALNYIKYIKYAIMPQPVYTKKPLL